MDRSKLKSPKILNISKIDQKHQNMIIGHSSSLLASLWMYGKKLKACREDNKKAKNIFLKGDT